MYCKNCGSEIAEDAKFCSNCGTPVEVPVQPVSAADAAPQQKPREATTETRPLAAPSRSNAAAAEPEAVPRKPIFEEFQWNVDDYPDRNTVEKTEDIDFNWNADPRDIPDSVSKPAASQPAASAVKAERASAPQAETLKEEDLHSSIFGQTGQQQESEPLSAADRIDKFYTFNKKNEEFQQLLNKEYQRVKSGNAIEHEMSQAEQNADQIFEARPADSSMEAFLEREGIVKGYQPKEFESDVLQRIEAQEAEKEAKRLEEEARLKAIEEARLEAENKKKAEEEAARQAELARQKAEEEAKAAEAARLRAQEEARLRAEEEARLRAEEEARQKAEAEARVRAEEEARLRAEADLKAAQEAARIRAQQEARIAAEAEARFKAEQEKRRLEAAEAQRKLENERNRLSKEANQAVAEQEARRVLEQTARMRQEEAAKIKAAVADLREGNVAEAEKASPARREVEEAHQATRNQINEMARARDAYFAELEEAEREAAEREAVVEHSVSQSMMAEKTPEEQNPAGSAPVTGRDTLLSGSSDLAKTRIVDKAAIMAGLEDATRVASKAPAPAAADDDDFFRSLDHAGGQENAAKAADAVSDHEAQPMDFRQEAQGASDVDDLLSQFESVNKIDEGQDQTAAFDQMPPLEEAAPAADNYGLNDTVIMPQSSALQNAPANDFDSYGNEEAANYANQQKQQARMQDHAMDDFYGDDFYGDQETTLSRKELKQQAREQKRLEKQKAKEAKKREKKGGADVAAVQAAEDDAEEGGKGRIVLKVILIILIVILAVEVIGIGIRFLAPQSGAAEFIENQLNKVIPLITGDGADGGSGPFGAA